MRGAPLLFVAMLAGGCGDNPDDWKDGRPKIEALRFVQQSPQDPYALEFLVQFTDTDGNTGDGALHLSVDEREATPLALAEVFSKQSPPLPVEATSGEFEVIVRMSADVQVGDELKIGFFIEDAAGETSNDPWVELRALAAAEGT